MESEGWKMRVVCVIWREDEVEEEEMKSRRRRRKERERERERERARGAAGIVIFRFFISAGAEGGSSARAEHARYRTVWSHSCHSLVNPP